MKHKRATVFVVVFGLVMAWFLTTTTTVADEPPVQSGQYGVEVDFEVSPDNGTYTCTAVVSDLVSGEVVASPRLTARIGEESVARSGMQVAGALTEIKLTFFADATIATYVLEVTHAGNLVAKQKSSLKL